MGNGYRAIFILACMGSKVTSIWQWQVPNFASNGQLQIYKFSVSGFDWKDKRREIFL